MEARYLRVKNWREHQHYRDRRPPWIKLLRELIDGDNGREFREELTEAEQWQLVRIWLYASGSERVMVIEGREVPVIAYDEKTIRIGIRSAKRVAVDKFVRLGFLEPVSAVELDDDASTDASTGASTDPPFSGVTNRPPRARVRATEVSEVSEKPYRPVAEIESVGAALTLLETIPEAFRDAGTRKVILAYADEGLPPQAFHEVRAELETRHDEIRNPAKYANGALRKLAQKRSPEAA